MPANKGMYILYIAYNRHISITIIVIIQVEHRSLTLGEVLDGDRMAVSMYNISFKESFERKELCHTELEEDDIKKLQEAIEDLYYFEFVYGKNSKHFILIDNEKP